KLAIVANEEIRMANLCVASCFSVNGVSALHSNIIKNHVFRDFGVIFPGKFKNVTNGIEHRRWLCQANPKLAALIRELIGDGFYKEPEKLRDLLNFTGDKTVLEALERIKRENKKRLLEKVLIRQNHDVDLNSVFDVQGKRLHEYKRQLLNVLHIMYEYHQILDFPSGDYLPKTYIFGAKAAAGYYMAKRIIRLIHSVASEINTNPDVKNLIKLVFLEDYKVSAAEILMPAAEVSEQISIAGKEASGTGNMKFMLNGALTIGTLDGANVEIYELVGDENIYIFGLKSHEVEKLNQNESYVPSSYYQDNPSLRRVLDHLRDGVGVGTLRAEFSDIVNSLLFADTYMLLADFDDYCRAHRCIKRDYSDSLVWNRKSLINIAHAGWFSADRSVAEYSDNIWNLSRLDGEIL
ncbi:MAG: glycogen/starch/alpha-glucan phosphorylase, partial [Clostridiales bacterium]|nr:glycogen/starch/alpha-glucan phosphorylase [Clostridiales bacterium]